MGWERGLQTPRAWEWGPAAEEEGSLVVGRLTRRSERENVWGRYERTSRGTKRVRGVRRTGAPLGERVWVGAGAGWGGAQRDPDLRECRGCGPRGLPRHRIQKTPPGQGSGGGGGCGRHPRGEGGSKPPSQGVFV